MSPEQKRGEEVDHRSDLYAVGLMAFQMLTGVQQQGFDMPSDLVDEINPEWDIWVKRALATRANQRFGGSNEMIKSIPQSYISTISDVMNQDYAKSQSPQYAPIKKTTNKSKSFDDSKFECSTKKNKIESNDFSFKENDEIEIKSSATRSHRNYLKVKDLSDSDLKKAYFASRNISIYSKLVFLYSLILAPASILFISDGEVGVGIFFIIASAVGFCYWYLSKKRASWHRKALLWINVLLLIHFHFLAVIMFFVLYKNHNLFGSDCPEHKDLKNEFKSRKLKGSVSIIAKIFIVFLLILILLSLYFSGSGI
jgi:hypothetical protein